MRVSQSPPRLTHMPLRLVAEGEEVECIGVVELPDVANEQEGDDEAQSTPHPEVEALDGDIHVVPLPQGLEAVQTPALVHKQQVLDEAWGEENAMLTRGGQNAIKLLCFIVSSCKKNIIYS